MDKNPPLPVRPIFDGARLFIRKSVFKSILRFKK